MSSWAKCGGFGISKLAKLARSVGGKSNIEQDDKPVECTEIMVGESAPALAVPTKGLAPIPLKKKLTTKSHSMTKLKTNGVDELKRKQEGIENYRPGGYHPVFLGDMYNNRYKIMKKLGWGHFSTVWLAEDVLVTKGDYYHPKFVALKVQKSGSAYAEAAVDEIQLLKAAKAIQNEGSRYVVRLIDSFEVTGPNGLHHVMAFEQLGENLLELIRYYSKRNKAVADKSCRGIPIELVKKIAYDCLVGLDFLHDKCEIIHTDLKPENILMANKLDAYLEGNQSPDDLLHKGMLNNIFTKIVDLGNSCWTMKHFTDYITTRQYRSPEAIVEYPYGTEVDIWSLACIVFELVTGEYLFDPRASKGGEFTRDEDHLALMMEILGDAPDIIKKHGRSSVKYFSRSRQCLRNIRNLHYWPFETFLMEKYDFNQKTATSLASFLLPMLQMDPNKRVSARQCLQHPWLDSVNPTLVRNNLATPPIERNINTNFVQSSEISPSIL